jgi:hypothetical protein
MPQVEIISEQEHGKAWQFLVQVLDDTGALHKHTLTLSWADYNLWSPDGADEPAKVAEAVMTFLQSRLRIVELEESFDASIARRKFRDADSVIPDFISR